MKSSKNLFGKKKPDNEKASWFEKVKNQLDIKNQKRIWK